MSYPSIRKQEARDDTMKIWIDIKNSHEPAFFHPFIRFLERSGHDVKVTAREYAEIIPLLERRGIEYTLIGRHYGANKAAKLIGHMGRSLSLHISIPKFDIALSHGSPNSIAVAKMRRKRSITFWDGDLQNYIFNRRILKHTNYLIVPSCIPLEKYVKFGVDKKSITQYNGFKEDISIADFTPDEKFDAGVPSREYVTIRPEALKAEYLLKVESIVPGILKRLEKEGIEVLLLPRYPEDRNYASGFKNVHIPDSPLNGLDVCWNSRVVVTGGGTFAREAGIMGVPAVSFFPGKEMLSVDKEMIKQGWMIHSRDPNTILEHIKSSTRRKPDLERPKKVQKECFDILSDLLTTIEKGVDSR